VVPEAEFRSYYGRPIIKEPVWTWEVPWYFFVGGLAGASASLGLGARLAGNHRLARSAWTAAAAGVTVGTPLLVSDLGRPERFHHMLRMFKVTSPLSVGSWVLAAIGPAAAGAAVSDRLERFPGLGRAAEVVAGLLGDPALLARTLQNLEQYLALDTVRNDYLMRTKLHAWFATGEAAGGVETLNELVYAQLFKTPGSDPWLGLHSPDVYTALDGGGVRPN
jgi:hypothetical protein